MYNGDKRTVIFIQLYLFITTMQKEMYAIGLLMLLASVSLAQVNRQPLGIPKLGIKPLAETKSLAPAPLSIESISNITGNTSCPCMSGCIVLPVKLLSFDGLRKNAEQVNLFWKTTNEFQNKGFEVQRSLGNTAAFVPVAFVPAKAANAAVNEYELRDPNNYAGISYYRLRQVDLDDRFVFSETIAIKGYAHAPALGVYPNPVTDKGIATVYAVKQTRALLVITDATQKRLHTQNIALTTGNNVVSFPAAHLPAGIYFIKIVLHESQPLSAKFIKL
jgi:hypothetical protein